MENAHILIVENEKTLNRLLKETLLFEGYTVSTVYDGEEALELLRNQRPNLILFDLMMPGIDGYEVVKRLRTHPKSMDIPIIVISPLGETRDKVQAFEVGADEYITKPFHTDKLLACIKARVRVQRTLLPNTIMQFADKERTGTIKIFYCYARKDKALRDELEKHLEPLRRSGLITSWYDQEIQPGMEWKREVDTHLRTSDIVLLLVSSNFIRSDYCYDIEMHRALEMHKAGYTCVIPIILRPCYWKETPIGELQALPTDGKPIITWRKPDEAFQDVVRGIRKVVNKLIAQAYMT